MLVTIREATKSEWIATLEDRESVAMNRFEHPERQPRTNAEESDWWDQKATTKSFRIWSVLSDDTLVGFINAFDFKPDSCETGVQIFEPFWRQGIATRAYPLVLDMLKHDMKLSSTWIGTHPENLPAQRLFEKLGYLEDGVMDDPPIQWVRMTLTF